MSITHDEFYRLIGKSIQSISGMKINKSESMVKFPFYNGEIIVELSEQTSRKIGSFVLPVTVVTINFHNLSNNEADEYLHRFNIVFQRGGG